MERVKRSCLPVLFACVCSLGLLTWGLQRPMWEDEYVTYAAMRIPFAELLRERLAHNHFPTYFLLARGWTHLAGLSVESLRTLSLVPIALACTALFVVLRRILSPARATVACLLFLLNSHTQFIGSIARMYGLLSLAEVAFLAWMLKPGSGAAYLGLSLAGLSLHPLFLRLAVVATGFTWWQREATGTDRPRCRRGVLLAPLLLGLLGVAILLVARDPERPPILVLPPSLGIALEVLGRGLRDVTRLPLGDFGYWPALQRNAIRALLEVLLGAATLAVGWTAWRLARAPTPSRPRTLVRAALLLAFVPLSLHLVALPFSAHFTLQPRYLNVSVLGFAILVAITTGLPTRRPVRIGLTLLALGVVILFTIGYWRDPGDGTREALAAWRTQATAGEPLVLMPGDFWTLGAEVARVPLPDAESVWPLPGSSAEDLGRATTALAATSAPHTAWVLCRGGPRFCQRLPSTLSAPWHAEIRFHAGESCLYRLTRTDP